MKYCVLTAVLCLPDASIPCSPIDYGWYHSNWVAVTLLLILKFRAWIEPDLSVSSDGGSWQRTEQQHIKEHQLGSSETFRAAIVFWEIQSTQQRKTSHHLHSILLFPKFNLAAGSWRGLDKDVIHYVYPASLSCPSNRCLGVSHPSCVLEQILRGE